MDCNLKEECGDVSFPFLVRILLLCIAVSDIHKGPGHLPGLYVLLCCAMHHRLTTSHGVLSSHLKSSTTGTQIQIHFMDEKVNARITKPRFCSWKNIRFDKLERI